MTQPFWYAEGSGDEDDPVLDGSEWDYVVLGGYTLPGILEEIPKAEPSRKADVKNAAGRDGATLTWQGYEPTDVTIKLLLWTEQHWEDWTKLLTFILPRPGKPPAKPFSVYHPVLAAYGITEVAVLKTPTLERAGQPGVMRATIVAKQWAKSTSAGGTTTPKKADAKIPPTTYDKAFPTKAFGNAPGYLDTGNAPNPPDFNVKPK